MPIGQNPEIIRPISEADAFRNLVRENERLAQRAERFYQGANIIYTPTNANAMPARVEPVNMAIPNNYDVGNVRAICYAIDSGISKNELLVFITQLNATFIEVEAVVKLYKDVFKSMSAKRMMEVKEIFKAYAEKQQLPARKDPCYNCKKKFIYWNLINLFAKPADSDKTIEIQVCSQCHEKLKSNVAICANHHGVILLGDVKPECPLYPKKCIPKDSCTSKECLHHHMQMTHNGYMERRWKSSKRFLSGQKGGVINSDIITGVEFEVVGKNRQSLRTNVFKLGKYIGIDHDNSLHEAYLATEVVTPPASGRKLEDMIIKVGTALVKDGFVANKLCGLHIHIDLFKKYGHINVNPDFYKSLLAAYCVFESSFYSLVPASRARNSNIRTITDRYLDFFLQDGLVDKWKFSKLWYRTDNDNEAMARRNQKRHESKYYWANFHSLLRKEGLEIRLMEGTIDANSILWWIRLNHEFIAKVATMGNNFYKEFRPLYSKVMRNDRVESLIEFLKPDPELLQFITSRAQMSRNSINTTNAREVNDEHIANMLNDMVMSAGRLTIENTPEENFPVVNFTGDWRGPTV